MMSKHYGDHRPQTATPAVSLRERPGQALFHISFSVEIETASAALGVLKRAALRLDELAAPTQSTLVVERVALPHGPGKQVPAPSRLHPPLAVRLAQKASTWERAAQLAQVDDLLRALVQEGRKHKPRLDVHRALPVFVVADPESYRPTLVKRLHERARSLGDGRAVLLKELRFDRPVEQRSLGLDQVELFLNVEGLAEVQLA